MIKKILYLPIETIVRELDANLLLAHEALKRGFGVVIGEKSEVKALARYVDGGVYVYKHWESQFPYPFDDERRRSFCYVGFHQEALVWIDTETFLRRATERGRSEKLDINFVKGSMQRQLLQDFYPQLAPVLKEVGSPTFDILRPVYRPLFRAIVDRLQKKWAPYVLVNSNFVHGNKSRHDMEDLLVEREKSSIKNVGRSLTVEERAVLTGGIEYKKRLFEEYKDMLMKLSRTFPDLNFILRPHPSEDHENWRIALKGLPNVHVVFEGNVVNWILGSVAVIHTGCTTALETWALHKPLIRFNPLGEKSPFESDLPNKFGVYASSVSQLEAELRNIVAGKTPDAFSEGVSILKPYLESVDGERSVVRIMDHIEKTCRFEKIHIDEHLRAYTTAHTLLWSFVKRIAQVVLRRRELTRFIIGEQEAVLRAARLQKFPGINARYVKKFLSTVSDVEQSSRTKSIRLTRVGANVLYLECKV